MAENILDFAAAKQRIANNFLDLRSEVALLDSALKKGEIGQESALNNLDTIFSKLKNNLAAGFKPKGEANLKETFNQSLFKHSKVERFTYAFLDKLIDDSRNKIMSEPNLTENLAGLNKLIELLIHIQESKLQFGEEFLHKLNHKLLSLNDAQLLMQLITNFGLGTHQSTVENFVASNKDLTTFKLNTIQELNNLLEQAPTYQDNLIHSP